MELSQLILLLHLLGAFFSFGMIIKSFFALFLHQTSSYKNLEKYLWGVTFYQTFTGIFLMFLTPQSSLISSCTKLGVYLGGIFIIQGLLHLRGREQSILPVKLD